jgi:hypothetical protein
MKKIKVLLGFLMLPALVACLVSLAFGTAHAQMSIWNGQWFKLSTSGSGSYPNDLGGISPYKHKGLEYLRIDSVDETNKIVNFTDYSYEEGTWQYVARTFHYIGDNSLDFLVYNFSCEAGGVGEENCMGFTARIKGKLKAGILTSATLKCIGGLEWDQPYSVGKLTFSGSLVPLSKLPVDLLSVLP